MILHPERLPRLGEPGARPVIGVTILAGVTFYSAGFQLLDAWSMGYVG